MKKYISEPIVTNDFYYDITHGGYIKPEKVLVDQEKAKKLKEAAELLMAWEAELYEDEMLIDL